jgi:hypothetical protein
MAEEAETLKVLLLSYYKLEIRLFMSCLVPHTPKFACLCHVWIHTLQNLIA